MGASLWPLNETGTTGAPALAARQLRQTQVAPFTAMGTTGRPLGAKSGLRPGTPSSIATITGNGPYSWNLGPTFGGVIDGEANVAAGPYGYAFDATQTGTIVAAGAAARVDRLDIQVSDSDEGDGSGTKSIAAVYTEGAATGGQPPAAPARSHLVCYINVPTSGAPTISWAPEWCGPGEWTFNTYAELTAYVASITAVNVPPQQQASVLADLATLANRNYIWNGTSFVAQGTVSETVQFHNTSPTGLNAGDTIDTMTLPALPYATTVYLDAQGAHGNLSASASNPYYWFVVNAGTLTQPASNGPTVGASAWGVHATRGVLSIPANTAVTVTLQQQSTQNKTIAKGFFSARRVGA